MAEGSGMVKKSAFSEWLVSILCRYLACQVKWILPKTIGLLQRLNRRTSILSNRKMPVLGTVDDGVLSDDDDRLGTSSEWDRVRRENVGPALLI